MREAVSQHAKDFHQIVLLSAEVRWRNKEPQVVRVPIDYHAIRKTAVPVGLALRIGTYAGPFAATDKIAVFLSDLAAALIAQAQTNLVEVSELQIDFDCAESKLDGYRLWLETIQHKVAPTPVAITALPSWLEARAFRDLALTAGSYILQVHSLARPASVDAPFTLCNPQTAQRAVTRAGPIGVPFRVALPTYGYVLAFDRNGKFIGLSAEGPAKEWPDRAQLREVNSNPVELAALVQAWSASRPTAMQGVIWYRLPVAQDILNWRWPTLATIMAGRVPRESLRASAHRVESGLAEISLENDGELDISSRLAVTARWSNARLVAGDGLRGFALVDNGLTTATFQTLAQPCRLPASEKLTVGWLRFDRDCEVMLELKKK